MEAGLAAPNEEGAGRVGDEQDDVSRRSAGHPRTRLRPRTRSRRQDHTALPHGRTQPTLRPGVALDLPRLARWASNHAAIRRLARYSGCAMWVHPMDSETERPDDSDVSRRTPPRIEHQVELFTSAADLESSTMVR